MKYNFLIFLLIVSFYSKAQTAVTSSSKAEKIIVHSKYGDFTFNKICEENDAKILFHFYFRNLDEAVDEEAEKKNITNDVVIVMIDVDDTGIITKSKIVKKGKLESFNLYVEKIFKEIIIEMKKGNSVKLNCDNKKTVYSFPVNYRYN